MLDKARFKTNKELAKRTLAEWRPKGLENIEKIPPETPIIYLYSHKAPTPGKPRLKETRVLSKINLELVPEMPRLMDHIVRPSPLVSRRILQVISPISRSILTGIEEKNKNRRKKYNKRTFRIVQAIAQTSRLPYAISIAPDGGKTPFDHPVAVDPGLTHSGGAMMLRESLLNAGYQKIAIIPVKFIQHQGENLVIFGDDISEELIEITNREHQAQFIAQCINGLQ